MEDCAQYPGFKLFRAFNFYPLDDTAPYHLAFEQQTQNDSIDDPTQSIDDAKPCVTNSLNFAIENGAIFVEELN